MLIRVLRWKIERVCTGDSSSKHYEEKIISRELITDDYYDPDHIRKCSNTLHSPQGESCDMFILEWGRPSQNEITISIPLQPINEAFEIYVMNNNGKTIDRYLY